MSTFTIDPQALIGEAISGLINLPIIVGLPSKTAPTPNFIFATVVDESGKGSVTLPTLQLTSGQLLMKSAVNSGELKLTVALSDTLEVPTQWFSIVATALQQVSSISNSLANFGSVLPNLSAVTTRFALSQLGTLFAIKNGMQPLLLMNTYVLLGVISQTNANLQSNWYIEDIQFMKEESDQGMVLQLSLKELLSKRDSSLNGKNVVTQFAGEIVSPLIGETLIDGIIATGGASLL